MTPSIKGVPMEIEIGKTLNINPNLSLTVMQPTHKIKENIDQQLKN